MNYLTDEQIIEIRKNTRGSNPNKSWDDTLALARAIEKAISENIKARDDFMEQL